MNDICKHCYRSQSFSEYDIHSDKGAYKAKFYTDAPLFNPRILVALGIMKVSETIVECNVCNYLSSICPYCNSTNIMENQSSTCVNCSRKYYSYL